MIPRSSGTVRTPSIVNVLPVPVCPYAKIVPEKKNELSQNKTEDYRHTCNIIWIDSSGDFLFSFCPHPYNYTESENVLEMQGEEIQYEKVRRYSFLCRGVNQSLWSHLRCSGENTTIYSPQSIF